jgi:hypothetical protein
MLVQFLHILLLEFAPVFKENGSVYMKPATFTNAITIAERDQVPTSTQRRMYGLWTEDTFSLCSCPIANHGD